MTPDGRAANQGVLGDIEGGKAKLDTQYSASQFALIVTAEPHFAVTAPSNMIVLYNVANKVRATETKVTSLTERSDYSHLTPIAVSKTKPPEVVAAEYSLTIAVAAGADKYAANLYSGAQQKLAAAETAASASKSSDRKQAPALARSAVIAGEDARREAMTGKAAAETAAAQAAAIKLAAETAAEAASADAAIKARAAAAQDLLRRLNQALPIDGRDHHGRGPARSEARLRGGYEMETLSLGLPFMAAFLNPGAWGRSFTTAIDGYPNMAGMWLVGEDLPQETNRVTLDPVAKDANEMPVASVHYDDHPNDIAMRNHAYQQGAAVYDPSERRARSRRPLTPAPITWGQIG